MLYMQLFILISIISVSYYTGSVLGVKIGALSLVCMAVLAAGIHYFTQWLTQGDDLITGIYVFLSPAAGLIMTIMMKSAKKA